ncbi:MAG: A/G-specific adenine glycosylase, partial [Actinomycetota bacterium]|nr:A/G-specific adenine glycosylase [Actinomycetota bacterium]
MREVPAAPVPVQAAVLKWATQARRDLPWRRTRDPWAVLVSELMLQQTQVSRVVPRYQAFLHRFPTPAVCAAAPAGEVVRLWAGLGYNGRALH